ncbi:MAG: type VI secretion system tip protein VgrG [Betaproteobacteria bacterium]|nr:type VI secretion system tip protein VgrG [Betaproteobacteria bacterium]
MNRVLTAHTPLGKTWWATSLQGGEALSSLYGFRVELKSKRSDIDTQALIGEVCSVACEGNLVAVRHFSGLVIDAAAKGRVDDHWLYELLIAPKLWYASRRADFKIFQNQTVQAIADQILQQNAIHYEWRLKGSYRIWEYIVQYGETDLSFLQRLLGHEGIYFWFEHTPGGEMLILGDHFSTHVPFVGYESIPYYPPDASRVDEDHFHAWHASRIPEPGKFVHTNYDFKHPSQDLQTEFSDPRGHLFDQYEIFAYPGTYTEGERQPYGQDYAMARLQGLQGEQESIVLEGAVRGVIPGCCFRLTKHPLEKQNREFLITQAEYRARNNDYESTSRSQEEESGFYARITAIPVERQYRQPSWEIKMPRARGTDTAVVVGPPGSEIHTDEYGRIKVHFHWDRYGKKDGNDSCWIRVSYAWAGSNFGGICIPRVGQEVVIDYEHGDPQRPLVIGTVYNANQMPPWVLPANKTQSGLMSRTSPGGGVDNTNAIRFEDAKGKEEMWVRAERNRRLEVKKDESTWIGNDRTQQVDGKHVEQVRKDIAVTSGANISHTAGGGIKLEAATQIVFQVGSSSIVMNADGTITVSGPTRVDIN